MNQYQDALILIVDDNPQNIQVLGQTIKEEGYKSAFARNGIQAIEFVKKKKPDLILMDVMMPEIDGIETCRRIKTELGLVEIPVIFLTGLTDSWNKTKAFEAGGVDFVTKPFVKEELLARVSVNVARKLAEDALRESEKKLKSANEELTKALATKDKFFSIIAHDLKSPFSLLLNLSEFLSDEDVTQTEKNEIIQDLQQASKQTFNLLKNLLEWSRTQGGRIEFEPERLDLSLLVDKNIQLMEANPKNISLVSKVSDTINVLADKNMIDTIIRNLLSNAIKFTPKNGKVEITAKIKDKFVEICVSDNGVGIKPENIDNIFRIDIKHTTLGTEKEKGTGIGLILCKEFAETNGGTLWVESELGKGSNFFVTIPVS
ncbi:MAG: hybrid sensor histidine kinase/response regulator [Leptospiraceae bacterium]|nr:hybrid sensor histidine kinase/response regulator [Leptospiraceae bacterium]MCP5493932.1 hybrid sensor histidine kinase/response regulator [Leptospiraceae bacterium]